MYLIVSFIDVPWIWTKPYCISIAQHIFFRCYQCWILYELFMSVVDHWKRMVLFYVCILCIFHCFVAEQKMNNNNCIDWSPCYQLPDINSHISGNFFDHIVVEHKWYAAGYHIFLVSALKDFYFIHGNFLR